MICLDFSPESLGFPIRCVRAISASVIDYSRSSFIVARDKSPVFSFSFSGMPCSYTQLHLKYCSCLSTWPEILSTRFGMLIKQSSNVLILSSFSFLSFSYSSNLFEIKSMASVSSASCFLPLICPSLNFDQNTLLYLSDP